MERISRERLTVAERQAKASALYAEGFSVAAIAQDVGVSAPTIYRDLVAALEQWRDENREATGRLIAEHIRRLDELYLAMLPGAAQGSARSAEVAAKILERQARLLGLDMAIDRLETDQKITVEYVDTSDPNTPMS